MISYMDGTAIPYEVVWSLIAAKILQNEDL